MSKCYPVVLKRIFRNNAAMANSALTSENNFCKPSANFSYDNFVLVSRWVWWTLMSSPICVTITMTKSTNVFLVLKSIILQALTVSQTGFFSIFSSLLCQPLAAIYNLFIREGVLQFGSQLS